MNWKEFFFSSNDLTVNIAKWINGNSKVALIGGLSGSGKSTLAKEMSSNKNWIEVISLDKYLNDFETPIVEEWKKLSIRKSSLPIAVANDINNFVHWLQERKDEKQYILEGAEVTNLLMVHEELMNNYTVIIKGTSSITSAFRSILRDGFTWESFKWLLKNILGIHKEITTLREMVRSWKKKNNKSC